MTQLTAALVEQQLSHFQDPYLQMDIVTAGLVKSVDVDSSKVTVAVQLGYPLLSGKQHYIERIQNHLIEGLATSGMEREQAAQLDIVVQLSSRIHTHKPQKSLASINGIKNIIAVASGKGGVGKSTTAVNIALALKQEGAAVGILDADIYGPSIPAMLGVDVDTRPEPVDEKHFSPIEALGLQSISMGYFIDLNTPVVWRGPKVSGALQQLLSQTLWSDLDYLIIDMPPGTGDIQLTLAQTIPVTGAVIVTTPQDIALLDAKKGIEMFRKVDVPVLGVVENMSLHTCSECGHSEAIFGEKGGERLAEEYQARLLGALPLAMQVREQTDQGLPTVAADPTGPITQRYLEIAKNMAGVLSLQDRNKVIPNIKILND